MACWLASFARKKLVCWLCSPRLKGKEAATQWRRDTPLNGGSNHTGNDGHSQHFGRSAHHSHINLSCTQFECIIAIETLDGDVINHSQSNLSPTKPHLSLNPIRSLSNHCKSNNKHNNDKDLALRMPDPNSLLARRTYPAYNHTPKLE